MGITSKDRRDIYYRLAKEHKFRARSAFKLMQIDEEFGILKDVKNVVDLCAAPGGWSQVLSKRIYEPDPTAKIVAVDIQPMAPIPGVIQLQGDITSMATAQSVIDHFEGRKADLVVCDGAPDVTGLHGLDEFMQRDLVLSALSITTVLLRQGGTFVAKVFRARDTPHLYAQLKPFFENVYLAKPRASRLRSCEAFVVGLKYKSPKGVDELQRIKFKKLDCAPSSKEFADSVDVGFVSCGDLSGWDPDLYYPLDSDLSYPKDPNAPPKPYVKLQPVQPPIDTPYKESVELKRSGKLRGMLATPSLFEKPKKVKVRRGVSETSEVRDIQGNLGYPDDQLDNLAAMFDELNSTE